MFSIVSLFALIGLITFKAVSSKPTNVYADDTFEYAQMLKEHIAISTMKSGKDKEQALLHWQKKYPKIHQHLKLSKKLSSNS